jgi:RNA polymerase sigma-70 factor, ECF subfamily
VRKALEENAIAEPFEGDPGQFATIFNRYFDRVFQYVFTRTNNRQVAEDLTSQIFLKILEGLPRYQDCRPMGAWIFAIAKNTLITHYRFNLRHPAQSLEAAGLNESIHASSTAGKPKDIDRYIDLERNINRLSFKDRELLRLRFAAGLSFNEIAAVQGKRPEAIKMALHRLLRKLERQMEFRE